MIASASIGWWGVVIGVLAGAVRGGTPFLLVSLGECLTEKSGKINLGLEGVLLTGAMSAYAVSYKTGNPWFGVAARASPAVCWEPSTPFSSRALKSMTSQRALPC